MTRHRVLVPLDGSAFSRHALLHLRALLPPSGFDVTLLRVASAPEGVSSPPARPMALDGWLVHQVEADSPHDIYQSQVWDALKAELDAKLEDDARMLEDAGFTVSAEVRFGDPADEIIEAVEREGVALVVMATHGRSGLGRLLVGSVAEAVLRRVAVPVMMVRPAVSGADEPVPAEATPANKHRL